MMAWLLKLSVTCIQLCVVMGSAEVVGAGNCSRLEIGVTMASVLCAPHGAADVSLSHIQNVYLARSVHI